jgi:hypothetical protein
MEMPGKSEMNVGDYDNKILKLKWHDRHAGARDVLIAMIFKHR